MYPDSGADLYAATNFIQYALLRVRCHMSEMGRIDRCVTTDIHPAIPMSCFPQSAYF